MTQYTLPIKGMTERNISQTFHQDHEALDVVWDRRRGLNGYGTPLCAPENVLIEQIFGDTFTPGSSRNTKRGYGLWMKGLETGKRHLFWHTLPYLPVWGGDVVLRGKIVAYMGNSGYVKAGGVYVPLEDRKAPYPGTHLHWKSEEEGGSVINQLHFINWNWHPTYGIGDQLTAMSVVVKKMLLAIKV